jgi:hypothetical protein
MSGYNKVKLSATPYLVIVGTTSTLGQICNTVQTYHLL